MKDEEKKTRKKRKKKNHRVSNLVLVLILLTGAVIMAYPSFSEYWNSLHQSRAIMGYAQRVAELTNEEYESIWSAALDYNERLPEQGYPDAGRDSCANVVKWTLKDGGEYDLLSFEPYTYRFQSNSIPSSRYRRHLRFCS